MLFLKFYKLQLHGAFDFCHFSLILSDFLLKCDNLYHKTKEIVLRAISLPIYFHDSQHAIVCDVHKVIAHTFIIVHLFAFHHFLDAVQFVIDTGNRWYKTEFFYCVTKAISVVIIFLFIRFAHFQKNFAKLANIVIFHFLFLFRS